MKTPSLKIRFAIAMSIGALVLVIVMGAISMHFAQDDLMQTLAGEQVDMITRVADDLDGDLRFAVDSLVATADATPLDLATDPERFDAFQAQHPALFKLFEQVFVTDARGIVVANSPRKNFALVGIDLHDRSYFQRVIATKKSVISEPLRGRLTGLPIIDVAVPILSKDGAVVAVMVGVLPLTHATLLGNFVSTRIGKTGYFAVMTTGARPIYLVHPDARRVMQPVEREQIRAMDPARVATRAGSLVSPLTEGGDALVSYKRLKQTDWLLVAVLPGEEAFAAIAHARKRTIRIGIVAALIALPVVWLFAWAMFLPLSRLRLQVEALAHRSATGGGVVIGTRDEVGEVAIAFNAMLAGQRAAEASRLASDQDRRRLVAILESSQDYVAMADVKGRLTYLNASARARCGIGLNVDLTDVSMRDHLPRWAFERLENEGIPGALRDGVWMGETAILGIDGREVPVDHTVIAHRNVDGRLEFFSSLLHDTSAAQAASIAMRSSEARMLSIADALPVLVSFIDRDYRYRFVNSRYEDHFGVDKTTFLGRSVAEVIGEKAYAIYRPFLERAARGESQVFEVESHAGMRPVHFFVKLIPQYDDDDRITGYHFIHQDVTDHKVENQRLSQLARADALTGLLNRAGFESAILEAMARTRHHLSSMALFYLDVDRFKSINDRFGHPIGDKLLRGFASRLVRAVRSADIAARLGGDEFVVIAEGVRNVDDVRSIAAKILRAMRADFDLAGTTLSITASVGVAIYSGEPIKVEDLVKRADEALYRAKEGGRNRYALDDEMPSFGATTLISADPETIEG